MLKSPQCSNLKHTYTPFTNSITTGLLSAVFSNTKYRYLIILNIILTVLSLQDQKELTSSSITFLKSSLTLTSFKPSTHLATSFPRKCSWTKSPTSASALVSDYLVLPGVPGSSTSKRHTFTEGGGIGNKYWKILERVFR